MSVDYSTIGKTSSYIAAEEASSSSSSSSLLDQEDFLELLTTQLTNQDPTEPVDNSQMVSTLAQLSVVSSLSTITENMDDIVDVVSSCSALTATTLVGRSVLVDSNEAFFDGSSSVTAKIDCGDGVTDLTVTIYASDGTVIETFTADEGEGDLDFSWDGTSSSTGETYASGMYTITATGVQDGSVISLPVSVYAVVGSVTLGSTSSDTTLSLVGYGDIALSEISEIAQ